VDFALGSQGSREEQIQLVPREHTCPSVNPRPAIGAPPSATCRVFFASSFQVSQVATQCIRFRGAQRVPKVLKHNCC
jgi:hypothetical protein